MWSKYGAMANIKGANPGKLGNINKRRSKIDLFDSLASCQNVPESIMTKDGGVKISTSCSSAL